MSESQKQNAGWRKQGIQYNSTCSKVRKQPKLINILLKRTHGHTSDGGDLCRGREVLREEAGGGPERDHVPCFQVQCEQTIGGGIIFHEYIYFVLFLKLMTVCNYICFLMIYLFIH